MAPVLNMGMTSNQSNYRIHFFSYKNHETNANVFEVLKLYDFYL